MYGQHAEKQADRAVIRLHGPDREAMDERAGKDWSRIVEPRDGELSALAVVLGDLRRRGKKAWMFVNNRRLRPHDHPADAGAGVRMGKAWRVRMRSLDRRQEWVSTVC